MKFPQCHTCSKNMTTCCPGEDFCQGQSRMIKSDTTKKVSEEKAREFYIINGGTFRTGPDSFKTIEQLYTPFEFEQAKEENAGIHAMFHVIEYSAFEKLQSENTMLQSKIAELEETTKSANILMCADAAQNKINELKKELCETRDQSDKRKELQIQISEHNEELIEENTMLQSKIAEMEKELREAVEIVVNLRGLLTYTGCTEKADSWLSRNEGP